MLLEIIDALRIGVVAIVESVFRTGGVAVSSFSTAFSIFVAGVGTSHPLETLIVILIFGSIGYLLYRFLWGSFKTLVIFLFIVIFLFVLTVIIL